MNKPFIKQFEIRWNDIDANRHLANQAYVSYMSHTRVSFLDSIGFTHKEFAKRQIGPVIFNENIFYFKEILPGEKVFVSLEIGGFSEDGMFFQFIHNFYDGEGVNRARCIMKGAWIDLTTRKLTALPEDLFDYWKAKSPTSADFKILTKTDMRERSATPLNIDATVLGKT